MASTGNKLISQYVTPIKDQSASRRKLYLNAIETNVELYAKDIAKKFNVNVDDVVGELIQSILTSDKKHPSPKAAVNAANPGTNRDYYYYLWDYYINDKDDVSKQPNAKIPKQPDPPKVTRSRRVINSKKSKQFVKESIDPYILKALGLEDIKDFTYEEYRLFLKEFLIKANRNNNRTTSEVEPIANELKRVKGKSGQFSFVNKQKVNSKSSVNRKIKGILPPAKISKKLLKPSNFDGGEELSKILKTLGSINIIFKDSLKKGTKDERKNRVEEEKKKRDEREKGLELGNKLKRLVIFKNILKPFESVLDAIKRFIFFTVLGKLFNSLIKWFNDPVNAKKVETLNRFIKDWWPAILAAVVLFLTPLGGFILTTLKIVKGLTTWILNFVPNMLKAIGGLKSLIGKLAKSKLVRGAGKLLRSPLGKAGLVIGAVAGTSYLANEVTGQNKAAKVQTENAAKVQSGKALPVPGVGGVGDIQATPYGMLQKAASGGRVLEGGYGGVERDTGVPITGAGSDTQLIAAEPGEVVVTRADQEAIYSKTGFDLGTYVGSRPVKKVDASKLKLRGGGNVELASNSIGGYQWGGIVGGIRNKLRGFKNPLDGITNPLSGAGNALRGVVNSANNFRQGTQRNLSNILGGGSPKHKPKPRPRKPSSFGGRPAGAATMPTQSPMQYGESSLRKFAEQQGIRGKELAAFLAQMAHESDNFKARVEYGGGKDSYSGGKRYLGRGYTQLTHDYNYKHYGKLLGIDLLNKPELAERPDVAAKIAIAFWKENVRPMVGNKWDDVFLHSRAINYPGASDPSQVNGMADREAKYKLYLKKVMTQPKPTGGIGGTTIRPPSASSSGVSQLLRNNTNQSNIRPYSSGNTGARVSTLPPISGGGQSPMISSSGGGAMDFMFSSVPNSALTDRQRILETYGVVG